MNYDAGRCMVDAILYYPFKIKEINRIKSWIKAVMKIAKGAEGTTLNVLFSGSADIFVLKSTFDSSLHEVFVAFFALNSLKKYIPNFM